ncbi:O-6-alkylguanine-DNA--cysteine-protein methyltransferase [Gloeobacter kilaueensis]|uniref:O-6-alkylguanine-DNA:cysteine-protein methyltransferase n=1 Tax=Gloeobacter kilaueensis (strain ATCC BAA-2537 / CCAP 1431/1 / ULC 316 / JS1) TaxID=1183438 RepID=U5QIZ4_GLOK1|nr:O-6-alkylguanine-DNA--cysteine-protein methyltransferase [Gloeobacter kilaueensis]AGY58823.1 O-6-alkylguanine-DNA:cysteine-protein methyltransferase [Gloeobacter kilaueensis JS1]
MPDERLYERIYATVRQIPAGKVATYGQVAHLAGLPGRARQIGYALFRVAPGSEIPWQRVVNARGEISESPHRLGNDDYQRTLLVAEGVIFNQQGQIDLAVYRWQPASAPPSAESE